jgi:hypothetical protein
VAHLILREEQDTEQRDVPIGLQAVQDHIQPT